LAAGQFIRVEYDLQNPDLVRVAGRDASLTFVPTGIVVLVTWAVLLPILSWMRRRGASFSHRIS